MHHSPFCSSCPSCSRHCTVSPPIITAICASSFFVSFSHPPTWNLELSVPSPRRSASGNFPLSIVYYNNVNLSTSGFLFAPAMPCHPRLRLHLYRLPPSTSLSGNTCFLLLRGGTFVIGSTDLVQLEDRVCVFVFFVSVVFPLWPGKGNWRVAFLRFGQGTVVRSTKGLESIVRQSFDQPKLSILTIVMLSTLYLPR